MQKTILMFFFNKDFNTFSFITIKQQLTNILSAYHL